MDERTGSGAGMVPGRVRGSFLLDRVYADSAEELGLPAQQAVLLCVLTSGPLSLPRLGATLQVAEPELTGLVEVAEASRYVTRRSDPGDARADTLVLTSTGASIAQDFFDRTCVGIAALTYGLSTSERGALVSLLGRFMEADQAPRPVTHLRAGSRQGPGGRPRGRPTPPAQSA